MQADFHYYATYCAAYIAGYSHSECMDICYSAQFVDLCSKTLLSSVNAPESAATTMLRLEMMDARTDIIGLQEITRIWAPFHFLPKDLYAKKKGRGRMYMNKYRLICGPCGPLCADTVELAKDRSLQSVGIAMHVLADTWAHANFAGTPSLVINNTHGEFTELIYDKNGIFEKPVRFRHSPSAEDDLDKNVFTNSVYQRGENSVMNLGHGRCGHLPDYSFITYRYMPSWGNYEIITKDNPSDYTKAFCQMINALKYLKGDTSSFLPDKCDSEAVLPYTDRIESIIRKRQIIASSDWKQFGCELSGHDIEDFDQGKYLDEYKNAAKDDKDNTFLGKFINGAILHKGMICSRIYSSGNNLTGFIKSV